MVDHPNQSQKFQLVRLEPQTAARTSTTQPRQHPRSLNNEIVSRQMITEINMECEKSDRLTVAKLNVVKQYNKKTPQALVPIDTPLSIIRKHIPSQSDIDKIVRNIETRVIHSLELLIQAQDLVKTYQTSTHFCDIYQYITDGKLPSSSKAQNCIRAEVLNYVVINNFLFMMDT